MCSGTPILCGASLIKIKSSLAVSPAVDVLFVKGPSMVLMSAWTCDVCCGGSWLDSQLPQCNDFDTCMSTSRLQGTNCLPAGIREGISLILQQYALVCTNVFVSRVRCGFL